MNDPAPYDDALEQFRPNEAETVGDLNHAFDRITATTRHDYGHAVRGVHAKAHAVLKGEFSVLAGLPAELAQGLFARPGSYDAFIRISTNPGDILDDRVSLPRGLAFKVAGVAGERLPGAVGTSQDFLLVNAPAFAAPNAEKFAGNVKLLAPTTDRGEGAKVALSKVLQAINGALGAVGLQSSTLAALGGAPQSEPFGETYYSTTPFRYGDYVAKFRLRPVAPQQAALAGQTVDLAGRRDGLRETLREQAAQMDLEWAFEVQLARDFTQQPVEDASVVWKEDEAPFAQVATLRAPRQDSFADDVVQEINETLRFSPWTGLAAHRPLGDVNRARKPVYEHGANERAAFNRCPIHEP